MRFCVDCQVEHTAASQGGLEIHEEALRVAFEVVLALKAMNGNMI